MSNLATHRPNSGQGLTVFFTGLSGAGKSTIAQALSRRLVELDSRTVTLLDGEVARKQLSSELGFSKAHRDIHIRRIGLVAAEITRRGGIAICSPIAPYAGARDEVRRTVEAVGRFVLVYVATPLEVCEQRDVKGLYAKARAGVIQQFTGISDPYEAPVDADIVIDTTAITPERAVATILEHLERQATV